MKPKRENRQGHIPPSHRNAEANEEIRGKVPISIASRLQQYQEAKQTRFIGSILALALDRFLEAEGF